MPDNPYTPLDIEAVEKRLKLDPYVGWVRWGTRGDNQQRYLSLCDSGDEGAFKFYRECTDLPAALEEIKQLRGMVKELANAVLQMYALSGCIELDQISRDVLDRIPKELR